MALKSPQEAAEKYARRASAASSDYVAGARRVTEAPGAKAASKAESWAQNTVNAKDRFKAGVAAVSLASWQEAVETKGSQRYSSGVQQGANKFGQYLADSQADRQRISDTVNRMPTDTLEQRIQRATTQMQEAAKLRGKYRQRG